MFGHSLGALVVYQVAHHLRAHDGAELAQLFVSGCHAPNLKSESIGLSKLPEPQFIEMVKEMGGTHPAVFENRELLRLILPALRADFQLCDTYQFKSELTPLRCPITALGGLQDEGITLRGLAAWRLHTTGRFTIHTFPGNHFFINTGKSALLQVIKNELHALVI